MRQLLVQVAQGHGQSALEIAQKHGGINLARLEAVGPEGAADLVVGSLENARVGPALAELQELPDLRVTFAPQGVLALRPPAEEAAEQVQDVAPRSPIEVFLSGLQSVGSWKGFLSYAGISGIVAWIGLLTNTVYLLTASMLIAPFAGPAMNAAVATARGDRVLLGRTLLRYCASLAVSIATAALLSLVFRIEMATEQMVEVSQLSSVAVLLPLAAGAAGALNLSQSERSSLVSGAATGMLVAASLAPPAALVGMTAVLGEWEMVKSAGFVLLLQVIGINLSGAVVFRLFGLSPRGPRYTRGRRATALVSFGATVLALGTLLTWQLWDQPSLQRASRSREAAALVQGVVRESGLASLVEANVRFTRADIPHQNTLLSVVYVQRAADVTASDEEIRRQLTAALQARLRETQADLTSLVQVTVLSPPSSSVEARRPEARGPVTR